MEFLKINVTKRTIISHIKETNAGCLTGSMEFPAGNYRGIHVSLEKLDKPIAEKILGKRIYIDLKPTTIIYYCNDIIR